MRTALCFQDGNFVGREYYARLAEGGRAPDLVLPVGRMKPESVAFERARTGGLWDPPAIPAEAIAHRFENTADPGFAALLRAEAIDVAIQGGIGILKDATIDAPRIGWLNVHPGALPGYRGNACPEWALLNGDPVVATAHLIDAGIDTGPVICAAPYGFDIGRGYAAFRAGLYRHCAAVLIAALERLEREGRAAATPQADEGAAYRPPLTPAQADAVRNLFPLDLARSAS